MKKQLPQFVLQPLNPLHYDEDRVMIGHEVVPMARAEDGVFWCRVCGGHPGDPVHQPGWSNDPEDEC